MSQFEHNHGHRIVVVRHQGTVRVMAGGRVVAETHSALNLQEADYAPVIYVPREDADGTFLVRSATETYCPYKGTASYFHLDIDGQRMVDAVWTYEEPMEEVAEIAGFLAFYPDRVEIISQPEETGA